MWIVEFKNKGERKWARIAGNFASEHEARAWLCGNDRAYHTRLRNINTGEIVTIPNPFARSAK